MHDRQYRSAIAWQQTAYNQPPHPGFFLGDGMAPAPVPNIVTSLQTLLGPAAPAFTAVADDTGASPGDFVTADPTLVLSGTAPAGTTVTVTRFGVGVIGTAPVDGAGQWSLDYTRPTLPEGTSTFVGISRDAEGTAGPPSGPFAVTVDLTAPAAPVIETVAAEPGLVLRGTAEAGSAVEVTLAGTGAVGTAPADAQGRWTVPYAGPALPAAAHTFTAAATDVAGNRSAASAPVTVDTALATPAILAVLDDTGASSSDGVTADNRLILTGTAGPGDSVSVTQAGSGIIGTTSADGSGAWSLDRTAHVAARRPLRVPGGGLQRRRHQPALARLRGPGRYRGPAGRLRQSPEPRRRHQQRGQHHLPRHLQRARGGRRRRPTSRPSSAAAWPAPCRACPAPSGAAFDVTVAPLSGEGTVRLDVNAAGGIADAAGNGLDRRLHRRPGLQRLLVGNGTWVRSLSGGLWSDNANWRDGIEAGGAGQHGQFHTLELLRRRRRPARRAAHDRPPGVRRHRSASAAGWIVDDGGDPANVLTLAVAGGAPTVTVNALGTGAASSWPRPWRAPPA